MPETNIWPIYDNNFYTRHLHGSIRSASLILQHLYNIYKTPRSVIDIGCGRGAWLLAAEQLGSRILKGIDGEWVSQESLLSERIDFTQVDMGKAIPFFGRYDLALCLEVAEHLAHHRAKPLIDSLCEASDIVLFSAAIKYQGGRNHINERRQSYWINLFKESNYHCFDTLRGFFWDNNEVEWWYRQNIFLFVNMAKPDSIIDLNSLRKMEKPILDIVHPQNYENQIVAYQKMIQEPTLRFCLCRLARCILLRIGVV